MLRKTIFWAHLVSGVLAGIVVFTMSFTGVVLMYERQIKQWVAESNYVPVAEQGTRLPLEALVDIQQLRQNGTVPATVVITNDPGAPVAFRAGRQGGANLNPYNGDEMQLDSPALNAFFSWNTGFHRWFNIQGENRAMARQITGVSNVIFLFLVLSGLYLWLPKLWKWTLFKARLVFRKQYPDSKSRDFHWHHIFGIWAALPLLAVVYTGAVISYPWAANLMYRAFGAEVPAPQQGGPGPGGQGQAVGAAVAGVPAPAPDWLPLDALVAAASADSGPDWRRMNLTLPKPDEGQVQIEIDYGNGAQAQMRHTLSLDRGTAAIIGVRRFADTPDAQRLRGIARFLHTGEVLGFWGQTVAGLASLAALFMVWTGFALSWRRLIQPLLKPRGSESVPGDAASAGN